MKKGQVLQGTVAYVDFPNKGVVKVEEGKQVIVKNVLPGQEISFSVNKVRKGKRRRPLTGSFEESTK